MKIAPHRIKSLVWGVLKTLFIVYAVVFSIAGTVALYAAYCIVIKPFNEVKALRTTNPEASAFMARCKEKLAPGDTLRHRFVPIDSISLRLQDAVLAAEDDGFYTHPGFDIQAMLGAMEYNRSHNKVSRGASTITQQLAKNMFLTNQKNFERKARELVYTLLLEKYLGKRRILELYLNYAQWGTQIFGCEAAAQAYYRKSCRTLSLGESARLAAVLAMPGRISPNMANSVFIGRRIAVIANNLHLRHQIDDSGFTALTGLPPPGKDSAGTADMP
ncbi:MAG: monofunctional biosynthetic peptidoglycan transglycosylase [Chitinispirillaceae bacterium]|jgi:monofunctional biosynthetic peptidoglycan transglycosylase|nr:monofunctional biosynthetic peptidoglycan transglycosylase [Chitinispirillaceae bacterium]